MKVSVSKVYSLIWHIFGNINTLQGPHKSNTKEKNDRKKV